jgi:hypothetical protein
MWRNQGRTSVVENSVPSPQANFRELSPGLWMQQSTLNARKAASFDAAFLIMFNL